MTKRAFDKIAAGLQDAIAFAEGKADLSQYRVHVPDMVDVRGVRARLNMTQERFAEVFGFTKARVRDWEQGRHKPDPALRRYLMLIERQPQMVLEVLQGEDAA